MLLSSHGGLDERGRHWATAASISASRPRCRGPRALVAAGKARAGCPVTGSGKDSDYGKSCRAGAFVITGSLCLSLRISVFRARVNVRSARPGASVDAIFKGLNFLKEK